MNNTQNDELVCQICSVNPHARTVLNGLVKFKVCATEACYQQAQARAVIAVHDGVFHADEVFAYKVLHFCLYAGSSTEQPVLLRTRDLRKIPIGAFVLDLGCVYDGVKRFDHHQKGGAGLRPNGVPYATFGLIWKALGRAYTQQNYPNLSEEQVAEAADLIDQELVQGVDAADNGVLDITSTLYGSDVSIPLTTANSIIRRYNAAEGVSDKFDDAVYMAGELLEGHLSDVVARVKQLEQLRACIKLCKGAILLLPEHLDTRRLPMLAPHVAWVVFPNTKSDGDAAWLVAAAPVKEGQEANLLPGAWGGLKDAELAAKSAVPDAVFCHNGLFIAGAKSQAGAIQMAKNAIMDAGLALLA